MNKISSLCGVFAALVLALPLVVVAPGMAEAAQAPAAKKKASSLPQAPARTLMCMKNSLR